MTDFLYLIPIALALGVVGLGAFLWSLQDGQYEDLDGAAERMLLADDAPLASRDSAAPRREAGASAGRRALG